MTETQDLPWWSASFRISRNDDTAIGPHLPENDLNSFKVAHSLDNAGVLHIAFEFPAESRDAAGQRATALYNEARNLAGLDDEPEPPEVLPL